MKGIIVYLNENNEELNQVSMLKLPLKEDKIVSESVRLYDEEEPCIIYRTAIINKFGINLLNKLEKLNVENKILNMEKANKLTENSLSFPKEVKAIKFI